MPPTSREDDTARRSVVPAAAGRSLWRAAVWTGVGAAVVLAIVAIVAVAIFWLPVSGTSGRVHSEIHAGLLTFLASLHGGITVDASSAAFLPLGMMLAVAVAAWRAGAGLADAAAAIDEHDPVRLTVAGLAQAASFAVACVAAVPFADLGTSSAPFLGVFAAAFLLFLLTGGTAFVRYSPLADRVRELAPSTLRGAVRPAAAVLCCYVCSGALLVIASLVLHRGTVETLSGQVGSGWGGVPVLVLGVLAAPNAVIAALGYLAGPGFAIGGGTSVSPFATAHGTVPAFPLLGALPTGTGANTATWVLIALTPVLAGGLLTGLLARERGWRARFGLLGATAGLVLVAVFLLCWQAGGSIGDGALSAVGPSPWRVALALTGAVSGVAMVGLGMLAALGTMRHASARGSAAVLPRKRPSRLAVATGTADDLAADSDDADYSDEADDAADDDAADDDAQEDRDPVDTQVTTRLARLDMVAVDDEGDGKLAG